jgi:hypothetical protein
VKAAEFSNRVEAMREALRRRRLDAALALDGDFARAGFRLFRP